MTSRAAALRRRAVPLSPGLPGPVHTWLGCPWASSSPHSGPFQERAVDSLAAAGGAGRLMCELGWALPSVPVIRPLGGGPVLELHGPHGPSRWTLLTEPVASGSQWFPWGTPSASFQSHSETRDPERERPGCGQEGSGEHSLTAFP